MKIQWIYLCIAAALLLPPIRVNSQLSSQLMTKRHLSFSLQPIVFSWQAWVDLARSAIGTFLLSNYAMETIPGAPHAALKILGIETAVLAAAVCLQSFRGLKSKFIIMPLFYLSGMTLGLSGLWVGGFAVAVAWAFAGVMRNPFVQIPATAVTLGASAYALGSLTLAVMLNCGLLFLAPLVGVFSRKRFALNLAPNSSSRRIKPAEQSNQT